MSVHLKDQMEELINEAKNLNEEFKTIEENSDLHWSICQKLATSFRLHDERDCFPIWLSRVVEGVLRDIEEGIEDV